MSSQPTFGRNCHSIADLERELYELFRDHPASSLNESEEPVIPGDALVDILRTFSRNHDAVELMNKDEEDQLIELIKSNPGLAVTPQVLIQFIAMRTTLSPSPKGTPEGSPRREDEEALERGRAEEKTEYEYYNRSRSSSRGSIGTSVYRPESRPPSRGPSVPPKTPVRESPFDASRRQRTQPLAMPPSSWSRRPPPARRKSDAGSHSRAMSDSETSSSPPIAYSRSTGRARAPSNPTTPDFYPQHESGAFSPISIGSPPLGAPRSRPHSRAQSQGSFVNLDGFASGFRRYGSESPVQRDRDDDYDRTWSNDSSSWQPTTTGLMSPPPSDLSETSFGEDFNINSLPMPRHDDDSDSDSDSDGDDMVRGLVHERTITASTISLDMQERIEALQRVNDELRRKLGDAEETLQRKLAEHESDLENIQQRLEEMKSELSATKRQEKELRAKERTNSSQISALEHNIAQLTKSLENSRQAYTNLQSQYTEQCTESQRYREVLLQRDEEYRALKETSSLHVLELRKWEDESAHWQFQTKQLEDELSRAQLAQAALDEQKHENMMLKETIDRMRFEMDEMRSVATSGHPGSGAASVKGSVSKSLGAELMSKMKGSTWEMESEDDEPETEEDSIEESTGDTDTESVEVETIITRKRKVGSRAKRMDTITYEEVKEYSDAAVQIDLLTVPTQSCQVQTDSEPKVIVASFSVQTDKLPVLAMSVQTDPEPETQHPRIRSVCIQTEELEFEISASMASQTTEEEDESMASSSSTVLPPTPKAQPLDQLHDHRHDLPPSYHQVAGQDQDELAVRVANETLKKWHKGLKLPIEPLSGGISEDAIEDWKALKEELGVECSAIDKLVEESARTGLPRSSKDARDPRHRSRFYNIYNTYVYGDGEGRSLALLPSGQFLFCIGVSAAVAFLVGTAMAPQYAIPGGATYYDRAAWSSFNSIQAVGEGFPGDGSSVAFWSFLGKLGGGAARTLRGWPT